MSVYKRGNKWYIDYYLPGGNRVREVAGSSKKLAEKLLAKRKAEILEGKYNVEHPEPIRLEELVEKFFEFAEHDIKPSSLERYWVSFRQLESHFNGKFINQITAYDIEQYKTLRIKYRSPSTVNRDLAFLRRIFKLAKKWGMLRDSPMDGVQLYRDESENPVISMDNDTR